MNKNINISISVTLGSWIDLLTAIAREKNTGTVVAVRRDEGKEKLPALA